MSETEATCEGATLDGLVQLLPSHGPAGREALRVTLQAVLDAAHRAWPDVALEDAAFVRALACRLEAPATAEGLARLHSSDVYLACACVRGEATALAHLERHFLQHLPKRLRRVDASPSFAADVLQAIRRRLLLHEGGRAPRLLDYGGRGPLAGWLRVLALRTGLNLRDATWRECGLEDGLEDNGPYRLLAAVVDAERTLMKGELRRHLAVALERALASLTAEDRNVLRWSLVERLSIDRLAVMLQIHRSTAARRVERARRLLVDRLRLELASVAGLSADELDSAVDLALSSADLSLQRCFG